MSECECKLAGWCKRHKVNKPEHFVNLCQRHGDYWEAWEQGRGPGQLSGKDSPLSQKPVAKKTSGLGERALRVLKWVELFANDTDEGLGDTVERLLAKAGGQAIKSALKSIGVGCGCSSRQAWLNKRFPGKPRFVEVVGDIPKPKRGRLIITIGVGEKHEALLNISSRLMEDYANRVSADFVRLQNKTQGWWGLEKFRVQKFAKQYEQTLFLDADILIKRDSPDIFELGGVALYDEFLCLEAKNWVDRIEPEYNLVCDSQGITERRKQNYHLNSGVVLCDKESADVWTPPPKTLPRTHAAEQFWVGMQAVQFPIINLDRRFNLQWWMNDFQDSKSDAWFVHYAGSQRKLEEMQKDINLFV